MRRTLVATLLAGTMLLALQPFAGSGRALAQEKKEAAKPPEPMKLKVGDMAPDFTLFYLDSAGKLQEASLHDYRGKKQVALAFYVFAFTGG